MPDWPMARSWCGSALMPFELAFHPEALREWQQLTAGIREQFKNKLAERADRTADSRKQAAGLQ